MLPASDMVVVYAHFEPLESNSEISIAKTNILRVDRIMVNYNPQRPNNYDPSKDIAVIKVSKYFTSLYYK